ncbi:MAG: M24 family metallopeptidase [Planctomycetaceae bacterium]
MFGLFRNKTVSPDEVLRLVSELNSIFDDVQCSVLPGTSTKEIDTAGEKAIRRRGYEPMFRSREFDGCVSTSIGNQVLGTRPSEQVIAEGDLVSLSIGIRGNELQVCRTWTFFVHGQMPAPLLQSSYQAMCNAVEAMRPGNKIKDVSEAIEQTLYNAGYLACREYQGYMLGRKPYADPPVPCFVSSGKEMRWPLVEGQVFSLEVIAFAGGWRTSSGPLGIVTQDGSASVHLSHIAAVGKNACRVLTSEPKLVRP